ncbi:hypothetical protein Bbelb_203880 [Branchiostoma belcheri]|nr:hypothetical protein Bbelb_203880 [Branchiostoma belcheri]
MSSGEFCGLNRQRHDSVLRALRFPGLESQRTDGFLLIATREDFRQTANYSFFKNLPVTSLKSLALFRVFSTSARQTPPKQRPCQTGGVMLWIPMRLETQTPTCSDRWTGVTTEEKQTGNKPRVPTDAGTDAIGTLKFRFKVKYLCKDTEDHQKICFQRSDRHPTLQAEVVGE